MRISSSTNKIAIKVTDLKSIKEKSDQTTVMTVNNSSYRFQNASFTNNTRSPGTYKSNYFGERQNLPRKPFHNNRSRATASAQAPFPREFAQTTYSPGNYYTSYTPPISYQYPVYSRPQNTYAYSAYSEFTPYYSSQEYNYPANYSRIPYQGEGYIPSPYDSNYAYGPNQNIYYPPPDYNTYNNPDGT
ncbi:hypothetical protein HZS_318 [Henneguya salminicola]|nr:hypothetical protein HZS_318 [Henneguya salminicola]